MQARECKDGWLVTIEDNRIVPKREDVLRLARQEGLRFDGTALNEVFLHPLPKAL